MRYAPYEYEYEASSAMSDGELMDYFLARVFETEEIWSLEDQADWVLRERADGNGGQVTSMPVWPYEKFAVEAAVGEWSQCQVQAESLEDFMAGTLAMLMEEDALVEIMPTPQRAGCLVSPQRLKSILDGMIEAGEYSLEG